MTFTDEMPLTTQPHKNGNALKEVQCPDSAVHSYTPQCKSEVLLYQMWN